MTPQPSSVDEARLAEFLRPFVSAPDRLPAGAAGGAPEVLPGLVAAVAVHRGDQVDFVAWSSMAELGGPAAAWKTAVGNLRRLSPMTVSRVETVEGQTDSVVFQLRARDPFGASRVCDLAGLLARTGVDAAPHGVLIAAPSWHRVLLHVITGPGVLAALRFMAESARTVNDKAPRPQRVSPDVYFVGPAGATQTVASSDGAEGLILDTEGELGTVLFGPRGLLHDFT